jgi:AcrR family transcriptional regulator
MPTRSGATAEHAFRQARRTFMAGQRLDVQALAADLGVNRVTLYRWLGSREQLLSDILWSVTDRYLTHEAERLAAGHAPWTPELLTRFIRHVLAHPGMRRFLAEEGDYAMRLLTLGTGGFQPRLVARVGELLAADVAAGRLATTVPLDDLAYTAVRIVESYVHLRVITGEQPDADRAGRVLHTLLR